MAAPGVDLVIAFRATSQSHLSKQQIRAATTKAEEQYTNLIETLRSNGLRAAGRRGEALGHLLVFVSSPDSLVQGLVKRERLSDFLHGLPVMPMGPDSETKDLSEADRLRLVHAYVTCTTDDGGLGIVPGSEKWDLVESVLILHDKEWNDMWVHHWTPREIASVQLDGIRQRFGDAVALYFAFLSSYTKALAFPAGIGALFYFYGTPYSPTYSFLVALWSIVFVEWWRVQEQLISLRFGTRGSFKVEKRRADYKTNFSWWQRELRMLASIPALLTFAGVLAALLTGIFIFEAFVTHLYTGPGAKYLGFSPTILFVGIIPRVVALWSNVATKLTKWENHAHHSSYAASLTLKTFALSAIVAYLGLGLSAFVYVPFGEALMQIIQTQLFHTTLNGPAESFKGPNSTMTDGIKAEKVLGPSKGFWDMDKSHARTKLNPGRLKDQMFAYTVTNQIVNTFTEVGLPFIMRGGMKLFKKGGNGNGENNGSKKKVVFEDEKEKGGVEEKEFLENVRAEAALPEFDLFQEYSEMVTQFGYVALWSTIWPLAPVMAMFNNFLELRSDAFKMTVHHRRPIPVRTDTIGPWLNALTFLSWLAALTNSALVYLFCPRSHVQCPGTSATNAKFLTKVHEHLASASGAQTPDSGSDAPKGATTQLLMMSLLIALAASHGYIILRVIVRHVIVRAFWKGSKEVAELEAQEKEIKTTFINTTLAAQGVENPGKAIKQVRDVVAGAAAEKQKDSAEATSFWDNDEGLEEITRISKEA